MYAVYEETLNQTEYETRRPQLSPVWRLDLVRLKIWTRLEYSLSIALDERDARPLGGRRRALSGQPSGTFHLPRKSPL